MSNTPDGFRLVERDRYLGHIEMPEYQQVTNNGTWLLELYEEPSGIAFIRHNGKLYLSTAYEGVHGSMWEVTNPELRDALNRVLPDA